MLRARYCSEPFKCISCFHPRDNSMREGIIVDCYGLDGLIVSLKGPFAGSLVSGVAEVKPSGR